MVTVWYSKQRLFLKETCFSREKISKLWWNTGIIEILKIHMYYESRTNVLNMEYQRLFLKSKPVNFQFFYLIDLNAIRNEKNYLKEAAIFPPSTVRTAPVVFFETAK